MRVNEGRMRVKWGSNEGWMRVECMGMWSWISIHPSSSSHALLQQSQSRCHVRRWCGCHDWGWGRSYLASMYPLCSFWGDPRLCSRGYSEGLARRDCSNQSTTSKCATGLPCIGSCSLFTGWHRAKSCAPALNQCNNCAAMTYIKSITIIPHF